MQNSVTRSSAEVNKISIFESVNVTLICKCLVCGKKKKGSDDKARQLRQIILVCFFDLLEDSCTPLETIRPDMSANGSVLNTIGTV